MTTALEGGEGSASRLGRSLPPGKTWYPLYRRLGGPQGQSGQVQKISHASGFDPRTVQPVASRYNDYATRPTYLYIVNNNSLFNDDRIRVRSALDFSRFEESTILAQSDIHKMDAEDLT
jgi:hypothetical protein